MQIVLSEIKKKWHEELESAYGGELEVDYFSPDKQDTSVAGYYVCAFHNEPKGEFDSWVEKIREFECLGNDKNIEVDCARLGIPVCR